MLRSSIPALLLAAALGAPAAVAAQARLEVAGGDDDLRDALDAASNLTGEAPEDQTPADRIAAARADYARLLSALYREGYFSPVVSIAVDGQEAARISPFTAPERVGEIVITVDPGPPFVFGRAEIGPLAPGEEPVEAFRPGEPASTRVLREATTAAVEGWRQDGHATADIADQRIVARNREARLDAEIAVAPGPRLVFGPLVPQGQERMTADRVAEIAGLPTGEVFDPDEVDRAGARLRRTGVFSSVALTEGDPQPDGTLPIQAVVVEAPLRRLGFGAEVSSQEGLSLTGYWFHRNLFGGGERLRFDGALTGIGQSNGDFDAALTAAFTRPATATPDTTFTADLGIEYLDEDTFEALVFSGSAGVEQQITEDLSGEVALGFRFSDITDAFGERTVTLLTLPSGLTYDSRDVALDATEGYYGDLDLTPFVIAEGGEIGARFQLDARAYAGFGAEDRTRLAARVQAGTVTGGEITDLPPGYLFFSGGGGTVRGHDFRELGAAQLGEASGGRSFAGFQGEIRQDVTDTIGLVAFYDIGYVSADDFWGGEGESHAGAGLGLRYDTPLGAIRLDVAAPVSGPDPSQSFYVYIGIGQSF